MGYKSGLSKWFIKSGVLESGGDFFMWVGVYEWRGGVLKDDKESSSGEHWRGGSF